MKQKLVNKKICKMHVEVREAGTCSFAEGSLSTFANKTEKWEQQNDVTSFSELGAIWLQSY